MGEEIGSRTKVSFFFSYELIFDSLTLDRRISREYRKQRDSILSMKLNSVLQLVRLIVNVYMLR